ncbi:hypothetical protein F2P81_011852 [Scophthalmus maximus]|uniref:EF-hand domain-containing protein n=1 Tax=Scophthalmus maximus TaxID=52904 RepID=A0A6A4SXB3_SCOMX|nr:hypothetical protein F2P81_011852 [Scophthalmus maximus]
MATDELSSKLSRRLQIEEGAEEPVAVDVAAAAHHNGAEEKASTASADPELGAKLARRGELNDGQGEHCQPSMRVFNPYTEFKEFSRKQIKDMEQMFKTYDAGKDNYIDLMELKLMMEKLGAPQTHLGLKNMIKEVDEDLDNKLSFREVKGETRIEFVQAINEGSRFEAEIRQEQEAKKKQAEEQKQRRAAFKELQSTFN